MAYIYQFDFMLRLRLRECRPQNAVFWFRRKLDVEEVSGEAIDHGPVEQNVPTRDHA